MRKPTQELRDAQVRGFLSSLQQPGLQGPSNMDLQRNAARAIHKQAAELADTVPPVEPPPPVALAQPVTHHVVRWHINPRRVTKEAFATLELAIEHAATLHWAAFDAYAIMRGREIVQQHKLQEPVS